jgi:hypothetical protein
MLELELSRFWTRARNSFTNPSLGRFKLSKVNLEQHKSISSWTLCPLGLQDTVKVMSRPTSTPNRSQHQRFPFTGPLQSAAILILTSVESRLILPTALHSDAKFQTLVVELCCSEPLFGTQITIGRAVNVFAFASMS